MLLEDKTAVIYGGGSAVGGAVARAFAREGASVFLAGRSRAKLDQVAREISASGGRAETTELDALDRRAIDEHADAVAASAGGINVALNAMTGSNTWRSRRRGAAPWASVQECPLTGADHARRSQDVGLSDECPRIRSGSYWPVSKLRSLGATIRGPG